MQEGHTVPDVVRVDAPTDIDIRAADAGFLTARRRRQRRSSTNLLQWQDLETNGPFASTTTITRTISPQGALRQFYRVWLQ
jgi:hypothetical protein